MGRSFPFSPSPTRARDLRVILYGVGAIGSTLAKYALDSRAFELVGAVDVAPDKVGRPLGQVVGAQEPGVAIVQDLGKCPSDADVVIHMAGSRLPVIEPQLCEILRAGFNCVSSSEELCFPTLRYPEIAERLQAVAEDEAVTCIAAGVNPGFVMDVLPAVASGVSVDVEHVRVTRVVDAATRREPLQRKVGAGIEREEFLALAREEKIGHVGLIESCAFISQALRVEIDRIEEDLQPKIAASHIETDFLAVEPGQVAGIHHQARGMCGDACRIELDLQMYVGAADPRDEVILEGRPEIRVVVPGGTPGDFATVAALINMAPRAAAAEPGLLTALGAPLQP